MRVLQPPVVIDRYAYEERLAIMEVEHLQTHESIEHYEGTSMRSAASNSGYATPYSKALTAAADNNWEPAKELCRKARETFGEDLARELMRDIQEEVKAALLLWKR